MLTTLAPSGSRSAWLILPKTSGSARPGRYRISSFGSGCAFPIFLPQGLPWGGERCAFCRVAHSATVPRQLTLQEISRKKPGIENRVAQEIEESDHCAGVRLDRRRNIRIGYRFASPMLRHRHTPAG